ncbi:MAG: hypothetical protein P1V34_18360 [Alphaproteobacteria bacterium]|nr:hypothetical protein [Alphaproteobacteria bacterium]
MFNNNHSVQVIANGLQSLTQTELSELDAIITPRAAVLLAKAFGPEIGELLGPLLTNDDPKAKAEAEQQLRQMMRDPRYWRDRDPQVLNAVSEGFKQLYPEGATSAV